jgi:hypothetical protein
MANRSSEDSGECRIKNNPQKTASFLGLRGKKSVGILRLMGHSNSIEFAISLIKL